MKQEQGNKQHENVLNRKMPNIYISILETYLTQHNTTHFFKKINFIKFIQYLFNTNVCYKGGKTFYGR